MYVTDSAAVVSNTPIAFAAPLAVIYCVIAIVDNDDAGSMGGIAAAGHHSGNVGYLGCQWQHFHYC